MVEKIKIQQHFCQNWGALPIRKILWNLMSVVKQWLPSAVVRTRCTGFNREWRSSKLTFIVWHFKSHSSGWQPELFSFINAHACTCIGSIINLVHDHLGPWKLMDT
jgi:hypothetical protein